MSIFGNENQSNQPAKNDSSYQSVNNNASLFKNSNSSNNTFKLTENDQKNNHWSNNYRSNSNYGNNNQQPDSQPAIQSNSNASIYNSFVGKIKPTAQQQSLNLFGGTQQNNNNNSRYNNRLYIKNSKYSRGNDRI